jgi:hypothetical protein
MIFKKISVLALVALFTSIAPLLAGKFKEIPKEGGVILQYDDDEGRRGSDFTIHIGKIDDVLKTLDESIDNVLKQGTLVTSIDFSNSDLTNEKFERIQFFLSNKKGINPIFNLEETDVDLFKENIPVQIYKKPIKQVEEDKKLQEDEFLSKQKTQYNFKSKTIQLSPLEKIEFLNKTPSKNLQNFEDSDDE